MVPALQGSRDERVVDTADVLTRVWRDPQHVRSFEMQLLIKALS